MNVFLDIENVQVYGLTNATYLLTEVAASIPKEFPIGWRVLAPINLPLITGKKLGEDHHSKNG